MPYLTRVGTSDVIIIGAGLAGLCAAIELRKEGISVTLVERHAFPMHKVCGEYLSREVVPYLASLGVLLDDAPVIRNFVLCNRHGRSIRRELPMGGIGISRYALDQRLYEVAQKAGVCFVFEKALEVCPYGEGAIVRTVNGSYEGKVLLAAWGKRSLLDRQSQREFWTRESSWMAIKTHFRNADFPHDQVGLYFFKGGYAGCSLTETGDLNFCCLIQKERFHEFGDPMRATAGILAGNPGFGPIFREAYPVFEKPLSIAQIDFGQKERIGQHTLYLGDAAHLIYPLCGNGMAIAIHSGRLAGSLARDYIGSGERRFETLARSYDLHWRRSFAARLRWGGIFQTFLTQPYGMDLAQTLSFWMPDLFRVAIRHTHGKILPV